MITCGLALIPHELLIRDKLLSLYTPLRCVYIGKFDIGLDFDQNLKANFKNNIKLRCNEYEFGNKTTPIKIVHYSAIHCVNLSGIGFRLLGLLKTISVTCF